MKGTVLWWSERDGNGIIVDSDRNEYYFDSSVREDEGDIDGPVLFDVNERIKRRQA